MNPRTINIEPGQLLTVMVNGKPVLEILADLAAETVYQHQIIKDYGADWSYRAKEAIERSKAFKRAK